jgi:thiamine-phosphate pyrophosphorylase
VARARGYGLRLPGNTDPAAVRDGFRGLLSQSCHTVAEVRAALAAGVDLVLLSPIWAPGSKPGDVRPTLGPAVFDALRDAPVLALGGVDASRVPQAAAAGAFGVAAIGAFFGSAADPTAFMAAVRRAYSTDQL